MEHACFDREQSCLLYFYSGPHAGAGFVAMISELAACLWYFKLVQNLSISVSVFNLNSQSPCQAWANRSSNSFNASKRIIFYVS